MTDSRSFILQTRKTWCIFESTNKILLMQFECFSIWVHISAWHPPSTKKSSYHMNQVLWNSQNKSLGLKVDGCYKSEIEICCCCWSFLLHIYEWLKLIVADGGVENRKKNGFEYMKLNWVLVAKKITIFMLLWKSHLKQFWRVNYECRSMKMENLVIYLLHVTICYCCSSLY